MGNTKFIFTSEPVFDGNEIKYVLDCFKKNWVSFNGEYTQKLESKFAEFNKVKYAAATSNGTISLYLALKALGIGESDEVIIPDFTIISSASSVILAGAKPVLCDVLPAKWTIDSSLIESKITPKTRAIMAVHMYGVAADMKNIMRIAKKYNLYVIEDACMAHGVKIGDKFAGSIGDIGVFSFYTSKTIAAGEGGAITTNSKRIYERICLLRNQGFEKKRFKHEVLGINARITDIQAAIAYAQLENVKKHIEIKKKIASNYDTLFRNIACVTKPDYEIGFDIPWMYPILINNISERGRDGLIKKLLKKGIATERFFTPMSKQPVFNKNKNKIYPDVNLMNKVAVDIGKRGLYLPSGLSVTFNEQKRVVQTLLSCL